MSAPALREAVPADADAIAALHAASWRTAYRGILSDAFLAPVERERLTLWRARLTAPAPERRLVLVAEDGGVLLGFACVLPFEDNDAAAQFYEALGAERVERLVGPAPGGGEVAELRYRWREPAPLAARAEAPRTGFQPAADGC